MPQKHGLVARPALSTNAPLPRDDGSLLVFSFWMVEASSRKDVLKSKYCTEYEPGPQARFFVNYLSGHRAISVFALSVENLGCLRLRAWAPPQPCLQSMLKRPA
ncbi:hypothetical protein MN608_06826 [Microdochium nivale]|nr:hypothetical protein MN608_06826 [Microdochium nivale]